MRKFQNGNWGNGNVCPLCNTNTEGEVVLIPIHNTKKGYIQEAKQIHLDCIEKNWIYVPQLNGIICAGEKEWNKDEEG